MHFSEYVLALIILPLGKIRRLFFIVNGKKVTFNMPSTPSCALPAVKRNILTVEEWKTNLMSLVILFHSLCDQHVSDINISIIRSLRLCCLITTSVVLFSVRCVLELWCGSFWVMFVLQASACKTKITCAENLFATGIRSRTVQPVARLYTDWAIAAPKKT